MDIDNRIIFFLIVLFVLTLVFKSFEKLTKEKISDIVPLIGVISMLSFIWFLVILNLWLNENKELDLNNWGDYLAGFFAPMLFLWVVSGIYLQKKEFTNAINQYKKSVNFLEKQSINSDIQHLNTWFNRNADMLQKYIDSIINKKSKPLVEINKDFISNNITNYRNIATEIDNIVNLEKYIIETLKKAKRKIKEKLNDQEKENIKLFNTSVDKFLLEFKMLFGKNCFFSKSIALKIYLQIYITIKITEEKETDDDVKDLIKNYYELKYLMTEEKSQIINDLLNKHSIKEDLSFMDNLFTAIEKEETEEEQENIYNRIIYEN
ncbi:hypothetical protein [Arcobacter arenosus]|uniref:Uncharacterized protein n=1 Tax=Arcobacter arenosus TaxID=2576037 RepID=A0A5R8XZR5_9BACT|nr:hypothetical protein [Arcobacter arenosus]TLP36939.1 hypothetical protein FDK22_11895 [Arcobacter arenosus]